MIGALLYAPETWTAIPGTYQHQRDMVNVVSADFSKSVERQAKQHQQLLADQYSQQ